MDWKNQIAMIQNKVRTQLNARKMDDLASIQKLIDEFDIDRNGSLDKVEFGKLLSKSGIYLTTQELTCVYNYFDTNRDGQINYNEFIQLIRSDMSEKRLATVKHAFQFLNVFGSNKIRIDDLLRQYRAEDHPRVRTREKTADQVRNEFRNAIIKKSADGINLTEAEFLDYYTDVNATLPLEKEEYFNDLVMKTWSVTSGFAYVSPERISELEAILYEKIRQKTFTKEDEGKTVKRAFKYFDLDDSGLIDLERFTRGLEKFGCVFNKNEILALFKKHDKDHSNKLNYEEFCSMFAMMGAGTNPNYNPVFEIDKNYPKDVIEQIRKDSRKRGLYGIKQLRNTLTKQDKFGGGGVTRSEFLWAIKEVGANVTKHDLDKLYKYFDRKANNVVAYPEFVSRVRGDLNARRADAIKSTWHRLTANGENTIPFDLLQKSYDPFGQHEVKIGKLGPEVAYKDFISQWDRKDRISYGDFFDFFWDLSPAFDSDDAFESFVRGSWVYPGKTEAPTTTGTTAQPVTTSDPMQKTVRFADTVSK